MLDFMMVATRSMKKDLVEIYPKFIIRKTDDLMIRGGDFYAIWVSDRGMWSTDEQDALQLIDRELDGYLRDNSARFEGCNVRVLHMWDSDSGMIDCWHRYCQKQMRDCFHTLDEKIIFSGDPFERTDYSSKRLPYPLAPGDISAYDRLMSVLYSPEERRKLEWAIGAIVTGDSRTIQKFCVLYGAAGTGKSTVLNIVQKLFEGYYAVFDARALGSSNNAFALEAFKSNPLVAIQHDGDLSHIEDNTRLNSLVSHELMTVNEKFKSAYASSFKCFLFMGTNKPVRITDAKSGLIRRLIDISPSGNKLPSGEYHSLMKQIPFELSGIAYHCREVYLADPCYYDDYIPTEMMGASNDFYNYILDAYSSFLKDDSTTLRSAWERYKTWCEDTKVAYPYSQRVFKEELKNYFREYIERSVTDDGTRVRSLYKGFRAERFEKVDPNSLNETKVVALPAWLVLSKNTSVFDKEFCDCPAQYASEKDTPIKPWDNVTTKLSDIDTSRVHYVKVPENHIVIDLDIKGDDGTKSRELNLKAASEFPSTYAEYSKSGSGIHLHYNYTGDVTKLSRVFAEHIEIKVFTGKSSLRRKLTECNSLPIAEIGSGLPVKGEKNLVNFKGLNSERALRTFIKRNLNKEYHPGTKPSVDFIYKELEEMYDSGKGYDVSDLQNDVLAFAAQSTNHADYCLKLVAKMHFKSDEPSLSSDCSDESTPLIFFDIEVFPNLFLINWKKAGDGNKVVRMINPKPADVEELLRFRLVGFNNRRYDNHLVYARLMGYDNEQLYQLSQKIITEGKGFFGEAYNISYTDVYDFSSKKQSLKKFEIELGIHHQELGLPWDKAVPEDMWDKVAEYCDNDVLATEAVFNDRKADFIARQVLADIAGMTVNDTTNSLTTRIIFGNNRDPQNKFNYRFLGDDVPEGEVTHKFSWADPYTVFDKQGRPHFPGYTFERGVSTYRGEQVGEGGYVWAKPGIYGDVALLDIASMHPSSVVAENLFGDEYTSRFKDILNARIAIKHKEFDKARSMLGGVLAKYLKDEASADDLAQALKIAINSVYGLTAAKFDNPFRDPRNVDNIVAKRGALFMVNLKHEVEARGFVAAHIKTDSIKIPNATPEIIAFVQEYGRAYGYNFEHETTYERMCLVNDAVYIAKYAGVEHCNSLYGETYVSSEKDICKGNKKHPVEWTATGAQFQVPYVFKKLFTKEDIIFDDMCETKSVSGSIYLDMNENLPDVSALEAEQEKLWKQVNDTSRLKESMESECARIGKLASLISEGHRYHFVGKVGQFCPIKPGCGGGVLLRESDGKYSAVGGSKGYRWLESEMVKQLGRENDIDRSYYDNLVNRAAETISSYGDLEQFLSDDSVTNAEPDWPPVDTVPHGMPCGRDKCTGCPNFTQNNNDIDCKLGYDVYPF